MSIAELQQNNWTLHYFIHYLHWQKWMARKFPKVPSRCCPLWKWSELLTFNLLSNFHFPQCFDVWLPVLRVGTV